MQKPSPETTRSGLSNYQHTRLWSPWKIDQSIKEDRQLIRLGLIERVGPDYFTTDEGKRVRQMEPDR